MPHPIWSDEDIKSIKETHVEPEKFVDKYAYFSVKLLRTGFDLLSGYHFGEMTETKWLLRIIFLETVAGVPGMMGAMVRHLKSLRSMQRDHGWIHTLLEEAENERMHLLVALELKRPNPLFRLSVLLVQGIFVNLFFITYMVSPRYCHRFVGYLEEEAVRTYSKLIGHIEDGPMSAWKSRPAPEIAKKYWDLREDATMRDVIYVIRADEAHHRLVNHQFSTMPPHQDNPFEPGF
uniref:Alternative oxidase n=1 Tax=Arcella intermedia TaxID=1963864 RepID=A0A6B2LG20_9EUKA